MDRIPYGRFTLIEPRGSIFGHVMLAPQFILLQRALHTTVRDMSYLVVWSDERLRAIAREISTLSTGSGSVVVTGAPEVQTILRAIEPVATALFVGGGECLKTLRTLTRRQLHAELRATALPSGAIAVAARKAS